MKKAVMYGAGNIGRGFIGQLFSQSGYEVVFIDINPVVLERLNRDRCYPVRVVAGEKWEEFIVGNVRGVNVFDAALVAHEIATADIMATAVGVNVLQGIAKPVAAGLKERWETGNASPLNIIICENLLDANHYLERILKQELTESEHAVFDRTIGLVEASIGRMVPVMTTQMQEGNPLRVYVEEYCELPVDKDAFKGQIPQIVNMIPFSPFNFYIQRKLFMHNMGHATTAYLGSISNYRYIWEACKNPAIKLVTHRALLESSVALSKRHGIPLHLLLEHADDLLFRFGNKLLADTIERVGRDPARKLSENDRLVGAAKLCLKYGVLPVYICIGIAAGFMFSAQGDEAASRLREFSAKEGIEATLCAFCNLHANDRITEIVIEIYKLFRHCSSLENIIEKAEKMKNDMYRTGINTQ